MHIKIITTYGRLCLSWLYQKYLHQATPLKISLLFNIFPLFCLQCTANGWRIKEVAEGDLGKGVKHRNLLSAVI